MTNYEVLKNIMNNLRSGKCYGKQIDNVRYPYFDRVLTYSESVYNRAPYDLIYWQYFGSSANKATLKELNWIISVIFKMSPSDFIKTYEVKEY